MYVKNIIEEFPVNIDKTHTVTRYETYNLFKLDRSKPMKKKHVAIGFYYEKEQERTFIPLFRFFE